MKLIEALQQVDKSKPEDGCIYTFLEDFRIEYNEAHSEKFEERLKLYPLHIWHCTDTHVGFYAIYMDGILVGYTEQQGRKSDLEIKYINEECAKKVRDFVLECIDVNATYYNIAEDLESDFPDLVSVYFTRQLLDYKGFHNSEPCEYVRDANPNDYISTKIVVRFADGTEKVIPTEEFMFPLRLNNTQK